MPVPVSGREMRQGEAMTGGPARGRRTDLVAVVALLGLVAAVEVAVRGAAARPLWYDELWRAYYVSAPAGELWSALRHANAPVPLGWLALTRGLAAVLGWHPWVLRLPQLLSLPLLGVGMYALTRRFTGPVTAFTSALLVTGSGTVVDLGTQVKPYTVEALSAVAVLGLWLSRPVGSATTGQRVLRRTLAGALSLFTVPLAFLVVPLAVADVLQAAPGRRPRLRAALEAAPALVLALGHLLGFVARQSVQRAGPYWDTQLLAGRGWADGLGFIGRQLVAVAAATPPGVDRTDRNLVHGVADGSTLAAWVLASAYAVALVVGVRVLRRRTDGQLVLLALLGAQLLQIAASAERYWPFGPTRNNLFLVPLLTLVPAVGLHTVVRRGGPWRLPAVALLAAAALSVVSAGSASVLLWRHQGDRRLDDGLTAAVAAAEQLHRAGAVLVVAGPLVRPGWRYLTGPGAAGAEGGPGTVFLPGEARPLHRSAQAALFVLDIERAAQPAALAWLAAGGLCPSTSRSYAGTGRLTLLRPC